MYGPEQLLSDHSAHAGIRWMCFVLGLYPCPMENPAEARQEPQQPAGINARDALGLARV